MRGLAFASLVLLSTAILRAQSFTISPCAEDDGNTHNTGFGHQERVCELREIVLPLPGGLVAVSGTNGAMEVTGEARGDIALEASVVTQASSREDAEAMQRIIKIRTDGTIQAHGPVIDSGSHQLWYVNYRLRVPHRLAATLHTENGGLVISDVEGKIQADTTNGGVTLRGLAGDVHASTVNGGLNVTLGGDEWQGTGLSAKATNGGVSIALPPHYSAHLVASTVNGEITSTFPLEAEGHPRNRIDTNLGRGGPLVEVETVNGAVSFHDNKAGAARDDE